MRLSNVLGILMGLVVVWILGLWLLSPWLEPTTWSLWESIKIIGAGSLVAGISLTVAAANEKAGAATFILLLIPVPLFGFILAAGTVRENLLDEHQQRQAAVAKVMAARQLQKHPAPAKVPESTVVPPAAAPSPTAKPNRVQGSAAAPTYPWLGDRTPARTLEAAVPPPAGFTRIKLEGKGFGAWLRGLPLLPDGSPVLLYTGKPKPSQWGYLAVVDIDVGSSDLQQCADSIMRVRAEYLWSVGRQRDIAFATGKGRMAWHSKGRPAFAQYLRQVFSFAGTATMQAELAQPAPGHLLAPGDVLVQGGHPGHAVLVLDAAEDAAGKRVVLLGQGYMPAQSFQVMNRPGQASHWYDPAELAGQGLNTSLWFKRFSVRDVRVFGDREVGKAPTQRFSSSGSGPAGQTNWAPAILTRFGLDTAQVEQGQSLPKPRRTAH